MSLTRALAHPRSGRRRSGVRSLFFGVVLGLGLLSCTPSEQPPDVVRARELLVEIPPGADAIALELAKREAILIDLARQRGFPEADSSAILYVEMLRGKGGQEIDLNDPGLRRRMIYWGEKILEERVEAKLDEASLRAHLEANQERYLLPERFDFALVYFSRERRGDRAVADARDLELPLGDAAREAYRLGDPKIGLSANLNLTLREIERRFGGSLASAFREGKAEVGQWTAPIESRDGVYRVHLFERIAPRLPSLEALAPRLRASLLRDLRAEKREAALRELQDKIRFTFVERSD